MEENLIQKENLSIVDQPNGLNDNYSEGYDIVKKGISTIKAWRVRTQMELLRLGSGLDENETTHDESLKYLKALSQELLASVDLINQLESSVCFTIKQLGGIIANNEILLNLFKNENCKDKDEMIKFISLGLEKGGDVWKAMQKAIECENTDVIVKNKEENIPLETNEKSKECEKIPETERVENFSQSQSNFDLEKEKDLEQREAELAKREEAIRQSEKLLLAQEEKILHELKLKKEKLDLEMFSREKDLLNREKNINEKEEQLKVKLQGNADVAAAIARQENEQQRKMPEEQQPIENFSNQGNLGQDNSDQDKDGAKSIDI